VERAERGERGGAAQPEPPAEFLDPILMTLMEVGQSLYNPSALLA
jgi:hypothetical protein